MDDFAPDSHLQPPPSSGDASTLSRDAKGSSILDPKKPPDNASSDMPGSYFLRFLQRDEWFALIPLKVLVQRMCDAGELPEGEEETLYPVAAEGAFELTLRGINAGLMRVGSWKIRLNTGCLSAKLENFYADVCPEKMGNAQNIATDYAGRLEELNGALRKTYGRDLESLPPQIIYRVRRASSLIYVIESASATTATAGAAADDVDNDEGVGKNWIGRWAVTFPGPPEKRVAFIGELEQSLSRFVEVVEGTGDAEFTVGYVESSVPERLGPLKQDEDGSSYYGKRIHAGSHRVADGLRTGSSWLAKKMVAGQEKASEWAGPAKQELSEVHPNVAKGLEVAQEGTGRLLDATKDLLGGLAAVASRGVSWAADKISKTEAYKEWEKKPIGPRAKAVHEIAGSAFGGMITVSYGIRDATNTLLDQGLKPSVVGASEKRWGKKAGDVAEKSVNSALNVHYTVLYGAKFVLKPAGAVVDKLTHLALVDSVTRSLLVEDLKAGPPIAEGSLLLSEFTAAGGMTAIWTNYVVVLRRRCIALYVVEPAGVSIKANPGVTVGEKGDHHKVVIATRGDRDIGLRPGDVIVGVGGFSVKGMSCEDVEKMMEGSPGTCVALSVCRADDLQDVADEALADGETVEGEADSAPESTRPAKGKDADGGGVSARGPRMVQVCVERLFVDSVPSPAAIAALAEEGRGWTRVDGDSCDVVAEGERGEEVGGEGVIVGQVVAEDVVDVPVGQPVSEAEVAVQGGDGGSGEQAHMTGRTRFGEVMRLKRCLALDDVKFVSQGFSGAAKGTHAEEMPFAFSLQMNQHKKPFLFQASSEAGMTAWVESLGTTAQNYKDEIKSQKIFG